MFNTIYHLTVKITFLFSIVSSALSLPLPVCVCSLVHVHVDSPTVMKSTMKVWNGRHVHQPQTTEVQGALVDGFRHITGSRRQVAEPAKRERLPSGGVNGV